MAPLQQHYSALYCVVVIIIISRPDVAWMLDRAACVLHTCSGETRMQVIMYDEPTAGLDPVASTVVEDLMRSMHDSPDMYSNGSTPSARSGITSYIVVTHQHSTIRRAVDRLIFLHEVRPQPFLTPLGTLAFQSMHLALLRRPCSSAQGGEQWPGLTACIR